MTEIIKIQENNGEKAVSARELHQFLEVKADFTDWCKRMFEYGFTENQDFTTILGKSTGGRPQVNYVLTLDCSKEIAMLQRTEKGKQARQYFIECEKQLRNAPAKTEDQILLDAMQLLSNRVEQQKQQLALANETLQKQAPRIKIFNQVIASETCHTTTTIAKELGMSAQTLNKKLNEIKLQYFHDGHWVLYASYQNKGYTKTQTHSYLDTEGRQKTSVQTVWTEKGRMYLHYLLNPEIKSNPIQTELQIASIN